MVTERSLLDSYRTRAVNVFPCLTKKLTTKIFIVLLSLCAIVSLRLTNPDPRLPKPEFEQFRIASISPIMCACSHPGSAQIAKNGYKCSDSSRDGYCGFQSSCVTPLDETWEFGNFPCSATVSCECDFPGSLKPTENGYHCSEASHDGLCELGTACLTPRGHVWKVDKLPCGPTEDSEQFRTFGAYSSISLRSACSRTVVGVNEENAHLCNQFENLQLLVPDCSRRESIVPRILHSVGHQKSHYIETSVAASNPTFKRKRHDDKSALAFILDNCGEQVAQAYACLRPPSYRADLFRFCAMYAEGGVYLDEDIVPLRPLEEIISECSVATIGHDFPADGRPAKQMKIIAAEPGAPIMKCAVDTIVNNVRDRAYPNSPLELTGPLMLQDCYSRNSADVAITYIDTRNSIWPFTGMRAGNKILAYEYPDSPKHFCFEDTCSVTEDYSNLFQQRRVYTDNCELN